MKQARSILTLLPLPAFPVPALAITAALVFAGTALFAAASARTHDLEPEDYFTIDGIASPAVSPDGETIVWSQARWEKALDRKNSDLWALNLETRAPVRLTFDPANEGHPVWSPDGRWIYYSAAYERAGETLPPWNGTRQVWRIPATGGGPAAVTRVEDGVDLWDLSGDGNALYYTAMRKKIDDAWKELREKHDSLIYGDGVGKRSHLFELDLSTWRSKELLDTGRVVTALSVASNNRIALVSRPDEELIHQEGWSRIDVLEPGGEEAAVVTPDGWRNGHPSPFGWLEEVAWSQDGSALAFSIAYDGFPTQVYIARWKNGTPRLEDAPRPEGVSVTGGSLRWRGGDLGMIGHDHARSRVYVLEGAAAGTKTAGYTVLTPGDVTVDAFAFAPGAGFAVVAAGSLTSADDLYRVEKTGKLDRLTRINPQIDTWKLPQISLVEWKGAGGDTVQGILELPPDSTPEDGPLPMVVEIHGGPTSDTRYRFRFWIYGRSLLPARGVAVFSPNYRGSTGYGDKFMTDLVGHENDIEVKDILAGVDAMVKRGIADPDRLGVMGWSNGGFLTNCVITATDRFKAASSGAGVIDQVIEWGLEDTPGHVINFNGGRYPWNAGDHYLAASPLYNLDKVQTPTLIHVGEKDERVPAANARTLYRGLRFYLKVPSELVIYPGAAHGLSTWEHRLAKMEWDLAWFDRYLLGKKNPEAE